MSISTLIIGNSGTGKTASIRNLDPANTLLIQAVRKPLPFRSPAWGYFDPEKNPRGNIFVTDAWNEITAIARKTQRKVIVVDDFQYVMSNEFMRRSAETGFQKFTEIARHAWDVLNTLSRLPDDVRVYILAHSQEDDMGNVKMKTIGKMLDEKITPEGLFSIVLRTTVDLGNYQLSTRNNGRDTVKTPMGLFDATHIDNDLAAVDAAICDYYGITQIAPVSDDGQALADATEMQSPEPSGRNIDPRGGVWESLSEEERTFLEGIAQQVRERFAVDVDGACRWLEAQNLETEEKVALWTRLDSKTRSALKKAHAAMKAAEQQEFAQ